MGHAPFGIHALFGRDPAGERLAPLLSDAHPRELGTRRIALRVRLLRRSRRPQAARA